MTPRTERTTSDSETQTLKSGDSTLTILKILIKGNIFILEVVIKKYLTYLEILFRKEFGLFILPLYRIF